MTRTNTPTATNQTVTFDDVEIPARLFIDGHGRRAVEFGWPGMRSEAGTITINRISYHVSPAKFSYHERLNGWRYDGHYSGRCLTRYDSHYGDGPTDNAWEKFRDWGELEAQRLAEAHHTVYENGEAIQVDEYATESVNLRTDANLLSEYGYFARQANNGSLALNYKAGTVDHRIRWERPSTRDYQHLAVCANNGGKILAEYEHDGMLVGYLASTGHGHGVARLLAIPAHLVLAIGDRN